MASVYFMRHQVAGILTDYPFASPPSEAQQAALAKLCFQRHGLTHPKTKETYWLVVQEFTVLGDEVPEVPDASLSVVSSAGAPEYGVTATGKVTPAKER